MKKKILILSTATGNGHNLAAKATKQILENENNEVIIYDFFKTNKVMTKIVVDGYKIYASKLAVMYSRCYRLTDRKATISLSEKFFFNVRRHLCKYISEVNPDLIFCTHPLAVNMVCRLKRDGLINIPIVSLVTDFKAHYAYIEPETDAYLVAHEVTKESLIERGICGEKIHITGIPVRESFFETVDDKVAADLENSGIPTMLLMGGGMGLNNISSVLSKIIRNKNDMNIIVICGNNDKLRSDLLASYGQNSEGKNLAILGYTSHVSTIMKKSDLLITKPGGLTTSEAIICNIPMMIPFTIPGQETDNKDFLVENGCAVFIDDIDNINSEIDKLIENPDTLLNMRHNMQILSTNYNKDKIYNLCMNLMK